MRGSCGLHKQRLSGAGAFCLGLLPAGGRVHLVDSEQHAFCDNAPVPSVAVDTIRHRASRMESNLESFRHCRLQRSHVRDPGPHFTGLTQAYFPLWLAQVACREVFREQVAEDVH